jgi:hypothetical protein
VNPQVAVAVLAFAVAYYGGRAAVHGVKKAAHAVVHVVKKIEHPRERSK